MQKNKKKGFLNNFKIKTKLYMLSSFMLVCLFILGGMSIVIMNLISSKTKEVTKEWLPAVIEAEELNTLLSDYRTLEYKLIVSESAERQAEVLEEIATKKEEAEQGFAAYEAEGLVSSEEEQELLNNLKIMWEDYIVTSNRMQMSAITAEYKSQAERMLRVESEDKYKELAQAYLSLVQLNKDGASQCAQAADSQSKASMVIMLIGILLTSVISMFVAILIVQRITKSIHEIDHVAEQIADGNLDEEIHYNAKDELGALAVNFNRTVERLRDYIAYINEIAFVLDEIAMNNLTFTLDLEYFGEFEKIKNSLERISDSLNDTMSNINDSSQQVADGSAQLASSANALAEGATEQAGTIQELVATSNEVAAQVESNVENAQKAVDETKKVTIKTGASKEYMKAMTEAMKGINDTSNQVVSIIQTIEEIADQTNLLALNASIEAARAGEAGRGFAVVASEIGKLADESSKAANNTRKLIQKSMNEITKGDEIVEAVVVSLEEVVNGVNVVNNLIEQTKAASVLQADSVELMKGQIEGISAVIQNNAAAAEETSATSEQLSEQAELLSDMVKKFQLKD